MAKPKTVHFTQTLERIKALNYLFSQNLNELKALESQIASPPFEEWVRYYKMREASYCLRLISLQLHEVVSNLEGRVVAAFEEKKPLLNTKE